MKMMNTYTSKSDKLPIAILRADAGSSIGFGHFVRTCALAAYLRDDFTPLLFSYNPDGALTDYQRHLASESGARIIDIEAATRKEYDHAFLQYLLPYAATILDNYYYTTDYQCEVRKRSKALVCIDDVHDRHFVADVVMTFCPLTREDFSLEPYTRFYGGLEYSFLRSPFLDTPTPHSSLLTLHSLKRAVLAVGGADPFHLTDKMLRVIEGVAPQMHVDVMAGPTVRVESERSRVERDNRDNGGITVWRQVGAEKIVELLDGADVGIFPASTVCVEALSRRLPIIAGHYVGNQKEFYEYGVKEGMFLPLGSMLDDEEALKERLEAALRALPTFRPPRTDFRARRTEITHLLRSLA